MTLSPGFRSANRTCCWRRPASCLTSEPSIHRSALGAIDRQKLGWRARWMPFRELQVCLQGGAAAEIKLWLCRVALVPELKGVCGSSQAHTWPQKPERARPASGAGGSSHQENCFLAQTGSSPSDCGSCTQWLMINLFRMSGPTDGSG